MILMESALYHGKLWSTYELKDVHGNYKEELRLYMRKESQKNQFICQDCKEHLILCAGPIMEPYFKHHQDSKCIVRSLSNHPKHMQAKRMLYHLACSSFPGSEISVNERLEDNFHAGILVRINHPPETEYVTMEDGQLLFRMKESKIRMVIEYVANPIKLEVWEEKHEYYVKHNILDIWILNGSRFHKNTLQTFEYMISKNSSNVIKLFDPTTEMITLKSKIELKRKQWILWTDYPFNGMLLDENGEFICDFKDIIDSELDEYYREHMEQRNKEKLEKVEKLGYIAIGSNQYQIDEEHYVDEYGEIHSLKDIK